MATPSSRHSSFFSSIHKSVRDGLISEKSFKYLHVSEVLSVEQPSTCRGQVTDGVNGNTRNRTALINTNEEERKNSWDALQGSFDVLKLNFSSFKACCLRDDGRGGCSDTI